MDLIVHQKSQIRPIIVIFGSGLLNAMILHTIRLTYIAASLQPDHLNKTLMHHNHCYRAPGGAPVSADGI